MSASTLFLANIPSPDRGVWELDLGFVTIPLRAYALCIIAGIIVAIWWGERRLIARGGPAGTVMDVAVWAVPFGLVGGRLYHVITDNQLYFGPGGDPLKALRIWDGGLGIWGAIALGAVGAWIGCKRKGIPLPVFADAVAPGIVVAQAIGRLGNYFNQELYGGPTTLPWGLELYKRVNANGDEDPLRGVAIDHTLIENSPVHPTFLYELLWNLLIAALIVWADRRFRLGHGRVFALYVAGYTVGRGFIEMMRTDPANLILGLRVNVWTSMLLFVAAVAYFVLAAKKGEREDLAALRADSDTDSPDSLAEDTADADDAKSADTNDADDTDDPDDDPADDDPAGESADDPADDDEKSDAEPDEQAAVEAGKSPSDK